MLTSDVASINRDSRSGRGTARRPCNSLLRRLGFVSTERFLLIELTHVPKMDRRPPEQVWNEVDLVDVVVHAGEWDDVALLDKLEHWSQRLVGVYGNNDHGELRERLPEVARAEIGGVRFAVVHETGPAKGREERCAAEYDDVDVLVFGHSHIPWDTTTDTGPRLLNPGSPTDRRRQPRCTYITATAGEGELRDVRLHRLSTRTPRR